MISVHSYEICLRKDHRGVDLISDALPFGRLCYGEPKAASNAIGYAKFFIRSHVCSPTVLSVCRCRYGATRGAPDMPVCGRCRRRCGGSLLLTRSEKRHRNDGTEQNQYISVV
jgi:hypothetical protein